MSAPQEFTLCCSRRQSLRTALILSVFAMMGVVVWCGWLPLVLRAKLLVYVVAGASGALCIFSLIRAVRPVPVLRATPDGIAYGFNWRFPQGEFRRWEDLADIVPCDNGLGFVLTEEYVNRQIGLKADMLRFNMRKEGFHEMVPLLMLSATPAETVRILQRDYLMNRPSPTKDAEGATQGG